MSLALSQSLMSEISTAKIWNRTSFWNHFEQASVENALKAVGALFLVVLHYHDFRNKEAVTVDLNRAGRLFTPETPDEGRGGMFMVYGISKTSPAAEFPGIAPLSG